MFLNCFFCFLASLALLSMGVKLEDSLTAMASLPLVGLFARKWLALPEEQNKLI